ncbi:MAG: ribosome-associated translation inhibitor RaiA [Pseudonocardia sp.]|nr:ribosome-associated translation inhibitor RaiA [Pseudonocardia sp.]
MEIVVTGRNVEVPEHFREHIAEKIARLERYDHKIVGMEVELFHERNRRQLKSCQRVEITGRGCGPVARAEACAQDFYAALDAAVAKLEGRLRRSHDRRRITGRRTGVLVGRAGTATALLDELPPVDALGSGVNGSGVNGSGVNGSGVGTGTDTETASGRARVPHPRGHDHDDHLPAADGHLDDDEHPTPGRVVRRKVHTADPMSIDDALSRMELVGHDFYLFADAGSGEPCVVYRRKGYDYGVIQLTH